MFCLSQDLNSLICVNDIRNSLAEDPFRDSNGACIPFGILNFLYKLIILCKSIPHMSQSWPGKTLTNKTSNFIGIIRNLIGYSQTLREKRTESGGLLFLD